MRTAKLAGRAMLAAVLLLAACDEGGDYVIEVGRMEDPRDIEAPPSAKVGESIVVRVHTIGGGCVTAETTLFETTDEGGTLTPYDRRRIPGENEACTLKLCYLPHEATVTFDRAGTKTIRVHARFGGELDEAITAIPVRILIE